MRVQSAVSLLIAAALLFAVTPAGAQVPTTMNYQVMLTDDADQALVDQAVEVVFRLYTEALVGSLLWTETHNASTNHIGVVSVVLGETTPLDPTDFDQVLWLEIEVESEILTPRRELTSAAFTLRAHDSDHLGGVQAADYALDADIVGVGDGHSLDASDGDPVNQVYVDSAGEVGIGTTTPNEDLHIHDSGGLAYTRFTNSTTGTGTLDGFRIGISQLGDAIQYQHEASSIQFYTDAKFRGMFDSGGDFQLGYNFLDGRLKLYREGSDDPIVYLQDYMNSGGAVELYDSAGDRHSSFEPDIDGDGAGYAQVLGPIGSGFYVDGNHIGSASTKLSIYGPSSTSSFYGGLDGNSSVVLSADAISAYEIFDEPGAASAYDLTSLALTGGVDVLESRTITCPGPGYVLAIATGEAYCAGGGATDAASFGVSTSFNSIPSGGAVYVRVPDGSGTGNWYQAVTVHGLFETSGGSDAFYFLADLSVGAWTVADRKLTLIYIPTAYGTVSKTEFAGAGDPETDVPPAGLPLTEADLALERSESIAANQARVDAELAVMRAEMAELRAELRAQNEPND